MVRGEGQVKCEHLTSLPSVLHLEVAAESLPYHDDKRTPDSWRQGCYLLIRVALHA